MLHFYFLTFLQAIPYATKDTTHISLKHMFQILVATINYNPVCHTMQRYAHCVNISGSPLYLYGI